MRISSYASLQSSYGCKTVAWVVELTYLQVVVKCESLLGGYGKLHCKYMAREERAYTLLSKRAGSVVSAFIISELRIGGIGITIH